MLLLLSFCLSVDKPVLVVLPFLLRDLLPPLLPPGPLLLTTSDRPPLVFVLLPMLLLVEVFTALMPWLFSFLMGGEDDEDDEEEEEEERTEETEEVEESADEVAPINPSLLLCFTSTFATDSSQLPLLLLLLP